MASVAVAVAGSHGKVWSCSGMKVLLAVLFRDLDGGCRIVASAIKVKIWSCSGLHVVLAVCLSDLAGGVSHRRVLLARVHRNASAVQAIA